MNKNEIVQKALSGLAISAMVLLFFAQIRIVFQPVGLDFTNVRIAYGYAGVTFKGIVYHDEAVTPFGTGTGVALHVNGSAIKTATTASDGSYTMTGLTISRFDIITIFIDGATPDGVLVTTLTGATLNSENKVVTGLDIFKNRLRVATHIENTEITTTNLNTADNVGDADVAAIYTVQSDDIILRPNKELYLQNTTTLVASGHLITHDLEVNGTLRMGTGNIYASGSVVVGSTGSLSVQGDMILTSVSSGEVLQLRSGSTANLYFDNGLEAYIRFDEGVGLNASGSTLSTATGGSLTNGPRWVNTNTGTTLFYNPVAVELDGTNDSVNFSDAWDLSNSMKRTFTTWIRRKSRTEDIIFSKKTSSGASNAGYIFYIDDATGKLNFELADGSSTYTVTSDSTITDQKWHHVGVSFNALNNNETNIFIDGAIDVGSKAGSMDPSGDTFTNAIGFIIGNDNGGKGPFKGSMDDFRIYKRVLSGAELSVLSAGNKATGAGTYYLHSNLDVDGNLGIYSGTLDMSGSYVLNVSGNLSAYGMLRTNSGSVTLDGSSQIIRGSTAFNQLAKTSTVSVTLTFESGTKQTVSGALTINGASNNRMTINASLTGSAAYLTVEDSGSNILNQLNVIDNNASGGALMVCSAGCVDNGNNSNWLFSAVCGDGIINSGEECDDGNTNNLDRCPNDCQVSVCGDDVIEGLEECDPPNVGSCLSNCLLRSAGGGGGGGVNTSAGFNGSFFNRPDPPEGCGNGILELDKGEECDASTRFNELGACSFDCKNLYCGDGVISPQISEDCEPKLSGTRNGVKVFEVATCGETCTVPEITRTGRITGGCRRFFLPACSTGATSTPATQPPTGPTVCGNGVVDAGEECDFGGLCDGGDFNGSFWTDMGSAATCVSGGGVAQPKDGDGCSAQCKTEFCGDGIIQERGADNQQGTADDEQCDNGSICSDNPEKQCRIDAECGNGNTCEYNAAVSARCSTSCKGGGPGHGAPYRPSAPPPSQQSSASIAPAPSKQEEPSCGNGVVEGDEECDAASENSDTKPSTCRTNCKNPSCGDFVVDAEEQCDRGNGNSNLLADSCRLDCRYPHCGDGVLDSNEQCDGGISCLSTCIFAATQTRCGNGVIEDAEQCDDGNYVSGDGCSIFCQNEQLSKATCGNGIVEDGEECDDGNTDDNDDCSNACVVNVVARKAAVKKIHLDADVVVVNPEEIANALKFIKGIDPCSMLVIKGRNQKASDIRAAALAQRIPIVKNIDLAQAIYKSISPGQQIFGHLCDAVNEIKKGVKGTKKPAAPVAPEPAPVAPPPPVPTPQPQPLPQQPTMYAGYYPYAQVTPMVTAQPPAGQTGPGMVGVAITGIAGGIGWIRRRRKK